MRNKWMIIWFLVLFSGFAFLTNLTAEEDQTSEGVTKFGVTHNVAPDREIVKVGGRYEPEGLDFYLKKKFDSMESKVSQLMDKMDELEKKIAYTNERIEMLIDKSSDRRG